jgi:3-deoxy-D-manno-octulosonic-acid transferase
VRPGGNGWHRERGGRHLAQRDRPLWLHAASLGEVQVVRAFVDELARVAPLYLTVQTETGLAAARRILPDVRVAYAPVDRPRSVRRFVEQVDPRGLVIFETEIWPHWLMHFSGPVWFANARLSNRSFARYHLIRRALVPLWRPVRAVHAQSERDRERFVALGVPDGRVEVAGQVKQFGLQWAPSAQLRSAWRRRLGIDDGARLWIGGSIRRDEFDLVLDLWRHARDAGLGARLIVAPRHLHDVARLRRAAQRRGIETTEISALASRAALPEGILLVLDSHGDLGSLYAACDLALLGGTFAPHGGHNPNEPARFGVPVVTGPFTDQVEGDLALLARAGLAVRLENTADFTRLARDLEAFEPAPACRKMDDLLAGSMHPAARLREAVTEESGFG